MPYIYIYINNDSCKMIFFIYNIHHILHLLFCNMKDINEKTHESFLRICLVDEKYIFNCMSKTKIF